MSQLGLMVVAVGLSSYNLALFHLVNHAFYKAALFLGAGSIIHAVVDNQDFRKYGGLREFLPLTYSVILIASLSLAAFPFLTGFYSKDLILESAYGQFTFSGVSVYAISTIGAIFTTLYSVKVLYLTFLANPNGSLKTIRHAHEGDFFLTFPLIILAVFSIFFGSFTKDLFIGLGSNFFVDNSIFIHPVHEILVDTEFAVPTLFKLLPFIFTISFSILPIVLSEFLSGIVLNFKLSILGRNIFGFFNQRFLVEMFYNNYITNLVLYLGEQTTKVLDKGSLELIGPLGLEKGLISFSKSLTKLSTGVVTSYALYFLVGLISFIFILDLSISPSLILLFIPLAYFSLEGNKQNIAYLSDGSCTDEPVNKGDIFQRRYLIDNLDDIFKILVNNTGLPLKDPFCLLYNKQFVDRDSLLKKYPSLWDVKKSFESLEDDWSLDFSAVFEGKRINTFESLLPIIKKNNASVLMPKESSFSEEKKVVMD